ncbi:MAG: lactate racemase domain-containing protein [Candidatus Undinarchaeales archaeon]|jgi:nickel-dependent lactate racemase|nr:lactate racemase domain-containing protein [Candidatus Undinarchaeales archaeon]MDP7494263.1 lactate racemase domain-containing protein [Candidatus Undinarchaeales archaeon]
MKSQHVTIIAGLEYGNRTLRDFLPRDVDVHILRPTSCATPVGDPATALARALDEPLGMLSLRETVAQHYLRGRSVLILVDDNTRPNQHTRILLPLLRDALIRCGVADDDVQVMVASGTHRPPTEEEVARMILTPELARDFGERVFVHDCDRDNERIGTTRFGTPVWLDRRLLEASMVIPLTDSEFHYFAGQAGTVKSICPGTAGRETIQVNHARMFHPEHGFMSECRLANIKDNPVFQDITEIARMATERVPVFGVDAVMDCGHIVHLAAGELGALHSAAAPVLEGLRVVDIERPGDIVVVSAAAQGINLYQAVKAVHCGWNAVRKDGRGRIVVIAPCSDGVGNEAFSEAMSAVAGLPPREAMRKVIAKRCGADVFRIGNQKPVDLLRTIDTVGEGSINMLTEMDPQELEGVFRLVAIPAGSDPAAALRVALKGFASEHERPLIYLLEDPSVLVRIPP